MPALATHHTAVGRTDERPWFLLPVTAMIKAVKRRKNWI